MELKIKQFIEEILHSPFPPAYRYSLIEALFSIAVCHATDKSREKELEESFTTLHDAYLGSLEVVETDIARKEWEIFRK